MFDRCDAELDLEEPAGAKRQHPLFHGLAPQLDRRGAHENQLAELLGDFHDLVQADAALVAGVVALLAAATLVRHDHRRVLARKPAFDQRFGRNRMRFCAVLADAPDETLGADQVERAGHEEGLDPHVHQAVHRAGGVVGVQRGEHEVTGQRRLDGDLGGLEVADLADENRVGILAEEAAQRRREVEPDALPHLHLIDAHQVELDRVLGGHDVRLGGIDPRDRRVQRVGLA
jgi:hypothetical protein